MKRVSLEPHKTSSIYLALEPEDAALILRADGSFETSFPEDHSTEVPDHILTGAAMAYALRDENLLEQIMDNFFSQCQMKVADK